MLKLFDGLKHLNTIYLKSELKPFQFAEFIFLILVAFFIPISWRIASYVMIGLFVSTILKGVFEEGFKINPLQYNNRIIYIIFIAFWVLYAVSFVYSENSAEARVQIGKKLPFLLFSLFFLCSNLSYLTKDRVKTIMYCLIYGILTLFIINLIWACFDILFNNNDIERLISPYKFFKTNEIIFTKVHRAYLSLMSCLGLTFCFVEIFVSKSKKCRIFNIIVVFIMTLIPFFLTSRAGMLCTIILLLMMWLWVTFIIKKKKTGILIGMTMTATMIAGYFMFPNSIDRITKTFDTVKNNKGDARITINKASMLVIKDNLLFGVGAGDRIDDLIKAYHSYRENKVSMMKPIGDVDIERFEESKQTLLDSIYSKYGNNHNEEVFKYIDSISKIDGLDYSLVKENIVEYQVAKHCINYELNAHNQYSETIITIGILGLLLLFGFFIIPVYLWIKNKNFDIVFFSLLFIIAFNSLFESIFERQMGIMFFVFFYLLLFHADFCQQTTDNGQ